MIDRLKSTDVDENMPKVDDEIRAVCMMTVSGEEENA